MTEQQTEPKRGPTKALEIAGDQLKKLVLTSVENGIGPVTGSVAYAKERLSRTTRGGGTGGGGGGGRSTSTAADGASGGDPEAAIRRIIRESVGAAGVQGFITGLGGFPTMPVTIPANVAGSLVINARMVGAIAYLRGYDLNDPHTQAMLMLTVAGSSAQGVLSELGVVVGKQAAQQAIKKVPIAVIRKINQKAGFYLLAKYGTKRSAVTLAKFVPGIGGLVGGSVDAALTRSIGRVAKRVFPAEQKPTGPIATP